MTSKAVRRPLKAISTAAWSRRARALALAGDAALLERAQANTSAAAGDRAFLARLAREICQSRSQELALSYRALVRLMPGFRRLQGSLTSSVCVVCVVRSKVHIAEAQRQCLPRWLIAFSDWNGERLPFAIPTDVQEAARFSPATAHDFGHVWLENPGWPAAMGNFSCVVQLSHDEGQQRCLLSAQHVLTPFSDGEALAVVDGLGVCPDNGAGRIDPSHPFATSLPYGGVLRSDENIDRPSFDVQLAAIEDEDTVRQRAAVRNLRPGHAWVRSEDDLHALAASGRFFLLIPTAHGPDFHQRLACRPSIFPFPSQGLEYRFAGPVYEVRRCVYHDWLLCLECDSDSAPAHGDSGSAVVCEHDDGTLTLVGMHIGGMPGQSWTIPAWSLFDLANWYEYPPGSRLEPVEP